MGMFGNTALIAIQYMRSGASVDPNEAWSNALGQCTNKEAYKKKGCVRGAFAGLCDEGLIKGIDTFCCCKSPVNKEYAISLLRCLREHDELSANPKELWKQAIGEDKRINSAIADVVITLYKNELLRD